jgi:hypothetical protein
MLARHLLAAASKCFERTAGFFGNQLLETPHQGSGALQKVWKNIGKSHGGRNVAW